MTAWTQRSPHYHPAVRRFDRYTVLGRLAVGGMAEVFLARADDGVGGHVIIKRMLPRMAQDPELVEMFFDEARLAMRLTHPNVCGVYDFGQIEGSHCIAMEWVNGLSLEDLLEESPTGLPVPEAIRVVADVAEGLHYAHRLRDPHGRRLEVVHRDVSPRNILVGFDGAVKLTDFGLAKSHAQLSNTAPGLAKGKLAFMAPEQWHEHPVDARTDVFALGVCLYEIVTGRPLYRNLPPVDTMHRITQGPVPSIREHDPSLPPALDAIVQRALAKDPADRYQTAAAMQTALEEALLGLGERVEGQRLGRHLQMAFPAVYANGPALRPTHFGASRRPGCSTALPSTGTTGRHAALSLPSLEDGSDAANEVAPQEQDVAPPPGKGAASSIPPAVGSVPPPRPGGRRRLWPAALGGTVLGLAAAAAVLWLGLDLTGGLLAPVEASERLDPASGRAALGAAGPGVGSEEPELPPLPLPPGLEEPPGGESPDDEGAADPPHGEQPAESRPGSDREADDRAESPPRAPARRAAAPTGGPARPDAAAAPAQLSLNTRPWSEVSANGAALGMTPLADVVLPAGEVKLRFVDGAGREHSRVVELAPGEHQHMFVDLGAETEETVAGVSSAD